MNIDKHTKGKWVADGQDIFVIAEDDKTTWIVLNDIADLVRTTREEDIANMERAALCVNTLDGVNSEQLEHFNKLAKKHPELLKKWILMFIQTNS